MSMDRWVSEHKNWQGNDKNGLYGSQMLDRLFSDHRYKATSRCLWDGSWLWCSIILDKISAFKIQHMLYLKGSNLIKNASYIIWSIWYPVTSYSPTDRRGLIGQPYTGVTPGLVCTERATAGFSTSISLHRTCAVPALMKLTPANRRLQDACLPMK